MRMILPSLTSIDDGVAVLHDPHEAQGLVDALLAGGMLVGSCLTPPLPSERCRPRLRSASVLTAADGLRAEALGLDGERVLADREVLEPEVAEAVGLDATRASPPVSASVSFAPSTISSSTGS